MTTTHHQSHQSHQPSQPNKSHQHQETKQCSPHTVMGTLRSDIQRNVESRNVESRQVDSTHTTNICNVNPSLHMNPPQHMNPSITQAFVSDTCPQYLKKYYQIVDAVCQSHRIINEWKPSTPQMTYEIEARFGTWMGNYFKSHVTKGFTEQVLALFETYTLWQRVTPWEESHDYFYDTAGKQIRTSVYFRIDPITQKREMTTEHIKKYSKHCIDFKYVSCDGGLSSPNQYDLRVSLNCEETVPKSELPSVINPSSVRIKSRKSFYHKSGTFPSSEPLWRFDVTRVWHGNTRTEAEQNQRNGTTVYEIELELLNPQLLRISPSHDSYYAMCSLLLKMYDFIACVNGVDKFKWEPVISPSQIQSMEDANCF